MTVRHALAITGAVAFASLGVGATTLNVRLGAWESTTAITASGSLIPPEKLARMTPQRRAQMEAALQAFSGKPITTSYCLTQKNLDDNRLFHDTAMCTRKVLSATSSRIEVDQRCGEGQRLSHMHVVIQADSPTTVTMRSEGQTASGGTIHVEGHGRWLSDSCAGVDKD